MPVNGLYARVPTSVDVENGSATIDTNGTVTVATAGAYANLNGVFSATYDNYMVTIKAKGVATADLLVRLSSAGTPATTSVYDYQESIVNSTSFTGTRVTATGYFKIADSLTTSDPNTITLFLFGPYLSQNTFYRSIGTTSGARGVDYAGLHNVASSYDGIRIMGATLSADFTYTITVYGFNQ